MHIISFPPAPNGAGIPLFYSSSPLLLGLWDHIPSPPTLVTAKYVLPPRGKRFCWTTACVPVVEGEVVRWQDMGRWEPVGRGCRVRFMYKADKEAIMAFPEAVSQH